MSSLNTWNDITFPSDCDDYNLGAIPEDQNCLIAPVLSQVSDLFIKAENAPAPFIWDDQVASINEDAIGNNVHNNNKSKWLVGKGGIPDPSETIYQGPKLKEVVGRRLYQLTFEVEVSSDQQRNFLRRLQSNWPEYVFWIGTIGGRLFGGPQGIIPFFSNAYLPLDPEDDDYEKGIIVIEFAVTGPGLPVSNNPLADVTPLAVHPEVISDGDGTVIIDDSGIVIGYY